MTDIFVFGSNLEGRHGAGAALFAKRNHGAVHGQGIGLQGRSYAIPTKETPYVTMTLERIQWHVDRFIEFARSHPDMTFRLTPIGCGLAGYKPVQIAPMFVDAPDNVVMPSEFSEILDSEWL